MTKLKQMIICATGFGLGGILWGWEVYRGSVNSDDAFINPFSYILGILFFAFVGGGSLVIFSKGRIRVLKVFLFGIFGFIFGFIIPGALSYYLFLFGGLLIVPFGYLINPEFLKHLIGLEPSVRVAMLWLEFLLSGAIISLFYSLAIKTKIWPVVWRGSLGFAIGSLIGPIIGNLVGDLFGCLFLSYLLTFLIIGVSFGKFLCRGIYKVREGKESP